MSIRTDFQATEIDTLSTYTGLSCGAGCRTGVFGMTESIFAEGIDSTFTTGTGGQTAPFDTGSVVRAGDIGVDVSITIIIDPIAHFLFGFLCVTGAPCALLTALNTLTTFAFAGTDELFVDLTIAVVVFSITDFGGWENVGDTWLPGIIFTGLFASTTCSGAGLRFAFFAGLVAAIIDCAIAVFVFSVVTDLRFGQDLVLTGLAPSACLTGLYTIPTQAFFAGVFGGVPGAVFRGVFGSVFFGF